MYRLSRFLRRHIDVGLFLMVIIVALLVRAYKLQQIPMLTDETEDVLLAARIARGEIWPLVSLDAYVGPLFHLLLATGIRAGLDPATWPRQLMLALGSLTVGLTYLLALSLSAGSRTRQGESQLRGELTAHDRVVGLVAAGVMTTAFIPVVLHSHVAWSNASSPFWTTAFLLAMTVAHRRGDPRWLVPAGALAGLAQQTHPSVLPVLLAGALFLIVAHRRWLSGRWAWLGMAMSLLAIANFIVYNIQTRGDTYVAAKGKYYAYAFGVPWDQYRVNLANCLRMAYQLVTSAFLGRDPEQGAAALAPLLHSPRVVAYAAVVALALLWSARRTPLPLLVCLLTILVISLFNRGYRYYLHARYLSAGLAMVHCALGLFVADLLPRRPQPLALAMSRRTLGAGLAAFLIFTPLQGLWRFYERESVQTRTNARLWQVVEILRHEADPEHPARLDRSLHDIPTAGGGQLLMVLDDVLKVSEIPEKKPKPEDMADSDPGAVMVLTAGTYITLSRQMSLRPLSSALPLQPFGRGEFSVYRLKSRP